MMNRLALALALMAVAVPSLAGTAPTDDWPMLRHDARNAGYTPGEVAPPLRLARRVGVITGDRPLLLASGRVVCAAGGDEEGRYSAVVLVDDAGRVVWAKRDVLPLYLRGPRLVVAASLPEGAAVRCYDWRRRRLLWSRRVEASRERLSPGVYRIWTADAVVDHGRLYVAWGADRFGEGPATLAVLRLRDGALLTQRHFPGGWWVGPPAVSAGKVYWGISHKLYTLDARTLKIGSTAEYDGNAYPVLAGSLLLTQGPTDQFRAVALPSGKRLWQQSGKHWYSHALVRGPGSRRLMVETNWTPYSLEAVDLATGRPVWRQPLFATGMAAASGHVVYTGGHHAHLPGQTQPRGGFYCFQAATGKPLWKYERPGLEGVAVIVAGGSVYGLGSDGWLYRFVRARGRGSWR